MTTATIIYQYNGYPQTRGTHVVRENITGNEAWEEYILSQIEDYGVHATQAIVGEPYQPATDDGFVCVRVPITFSCAGKVGEVRKALDKYCENAQDWEEGFYCNRCWVEEVKR